MKKRFLSMVCAAVMAVSALTLSGCQAGPKEEKIGIIQLVENGAFNDMRKGIVDELLANGYTEKQIDYQCAQGDASTVQTIAANMSKGYAAVFTIATPGTQAFVNQESKTPCFFCSVSAPVAAGVISDMNKPDKNATGTSNAIPISDIFGLANRLTPDAKSFGFLYCTSEVNSVNTVTQAKDYCKANGISFEEISVTNSSEVETAVRSLCDKVDVIFIPNDSVIQSAMEIVSEIAREKKVPTYASSATTVQSGAFATIAISDVEIGKITAQMALKHLKDGVAVSDIPSVVVPASATVVNEDTMKALGINLSDTSDITFLKDAK